jgi:hypothetical protein
MVTAHGNPNGGGATTTPVQSEGVASEGGYEPPLWLIKG